MALPKNKKIGKITVDNVQYYWTINYDEDYGLVMCNIGLVEKPNYTFGFQRGVDQSHVRHIHNSIEGKDELHAITPGLVKEAIVYANQNLDWKNPSACWIYSDSEGFSKKR